MSDAANDGRKTDRYEKVRIGYRIAFIMRIIEDTPARRKKLTQSMKTYNKEIGDVSFSEMKKMTNTLIEKMLVQKKLKAWQGVEEYTEHCTEDIKHLFYEKAKSLGVGHQKWVLE